MVHKIVEKLYTTQHLSADEYRYLLEHNTVECRAMLAELASERARHYFGNAIYTRGLIEISNVCRNNCFYCGIRAGNSALHRFRLSKEDILECCAQGYELGFRTFVLQGGEDPFFTADYLVETVSEIHTRYPDCAITLSMGEWDEESYRRFYEAGATRYLLRHETHNAAHYAQLHPASMSLEHRLGCLDALKRIGYQTGTGIMVGSPGQTIDHLVEDLLYIEQLQPEMIGIGPFLPHHDTPFANEAKGSLEMTLLLISILRLMFPMANIPATTSLATIDPNGREMGILAGANVVMPNLSPKSLRVLYSLYDNKVATNEEAAESRSKLAAKVATIGYCLSDSKGDFGEVLEKLPGEACK